MIQYILGITQIMKDLGECPEHIGKICFYKHVSLCNLSSPVNANKPKTFMNGNGCIHFDN